MKSLPIMTFIHENLRTRDILCEIYSQSNPSNLNLHCFRAEDKLQIGEEVLFLQTIKEKHLTQNIEEKQNANLQYRVSNFSPSSMILFELHPSLSICVFVRRDWLLLFP